MQLNYTKFIIILIAMLIAVRLIELNSLGSLKIKIVNDIDAILIWTIFTAIMFSVISLFINGFTYRIWVTIIIICVSLIILLYRVISIRKIYNNIEKQYNTYDLKELYDGKIVNDGNIILINEEDVSYDLLEREKTINTIYETIINCSPRKKFVISVEGAWGSGKTTLLNIIKNKIRESNKDIIIIDEFDPWTYNDQASMFRGMFDILLKECGIKYSIAQSKKFNDSLYEALFSGKREKQIKIFEIYNKDNSGDVKKVKDMINNYLKISNKKIIFIIDNIDRIEKDKVLLLFKLVGNILDFEQITYILSFDDKRIFDIMEKEIDIDYDYLKKIIQLQVKVPPIDPDVKIHVIETCVKNLLILYGEEEVNLNQYNNLIHNISNIINDIRDLKRFINSVMSFYHRSNKVLNPIDIITIELIRIYNNELYNSILNNKQYFISYDQIFSSELYSNIFNKKKFNEYGKLYFDKLFSDNRNKIYLDLLADIFPYVKKYKLGASLEYDGNIVNNDNKNYKSTVKNRRICSLKFFDLYFSKSNNEFNYISNIVEEFVKSVNSGESISDRLYLLINELQPQYHKVTFETLQYYINNIEDIRLKGLALEIFHNIYKIDDSREIFNLSARSRATIIISDILLKLSDCEFREYIESIEQEYSKLEIMDSIRSWVECNKDVQNHIKQNRYKCWKEFNKLIGKRVYDNNINLYGEFYYEKNIWGLYRILKDDERDIKKYIENILTEDNIVRFIFDIIGISVGKNYIYKVNIENIECLTDIEKINELIAKRTSNTKDEEFVLKVYNNFINSIKNNSEEDGIECVEEVKLNL